MLPASPFPSHLGVLHRFVRLIARESEARIHLTGVEPDRSFVKAIERSTKSLGHLQSLREIGGYRGKIAPGNHRALGEDWRTAVLWEDFLESVQDHFAWDSQVSSGVYGTNHSWRALLFRLGFNEILLWPVHFGSMI
jgi:hypothetical protein